MIGLGSSITSGVPESKYSASFDGIDDFIDTGQTFQSTFRGDFTFSLWVKPADGITSTLHFPFGSDAGGSNSIVRFRIQHGDIFFKFQANGNALNFRTDGVNFPKVFTNGEQDSWTHILISLKNNGGSNTPTCNIHVNGDSPAPLTSGSTNNITGSDQSALSMSENLLIGRRTQSSSSFFEGGIDEFAIFNAILDTDNAAAIYNGGSPLNLSFDKGNYNNSSNLVAYYKMGNGLFDDIKNGVIHNQVNPGIGNNLIVNGTFSADSNWSETENESQNTAGVFSRVVISDGKAQFTVNDAAYVKLTQLLTLTSGKIYKLTATVNGTANFNMRFRDSTINDSGNNTGDGGLNTTNGIIAMTGSEKSVVLYFEANSFSQGIHIERSSGGDYSFTVDNVLLQELNGKPGITSGGTIFSSDTPTP